MSDDKRKFVRLETLLEVVHRKDSHPSAAILTLTNNISQGGVCFINYDEINNFNVADLISLSLFFPFDADPVKTKGKVSWIKNHAKISQDDKDKYEMGIEFIEIQEIDKKKIEQYIKEKLNSKT